MIRHFQRSTYNGTATARLWRLLPAAAALAVGLGCGGCSLSYQFDSLVGKSDKSETTGSINASSAKAPDAPVSAPVLPPEQDLAFTRAAVVAALGRDRKDVSLPWENPTSGARGTVTPIAAVYNQDGAVCRDFLASYVSGRVESWLRGEACRQPKGKWEVRSLKPWAHS